MKSHDYSIIEWVVCPKCNAICDAPFAHVDSSGAGPELVLGNELADSDIVPGTEWEELVTATCPTCHNSIAAVAMFNGRTLRHFGLQTEASNSK